MSYSYYTYVSYFWLVLFFPWAILPILRQTVTGACPVTTDLIARVNVRTSATLMRTTA